MRQVLKMGITAAALLRRMNDPTLAPTVASGSFFVNRHPAPDRTAIAAARFHWRSWPASTRPQHRFFASWSGGGRRAVEADAFERLEFDIRTGRIIATVSTRTLGNKGTPIGTGRWVR